MPLWLLSAFGFVKKAAGVALSFLEPRPSFTHDDLAHHRLANSKFFAKLFLAYPACHLADEKDISLGQLRIRATLAAMHFSVKNFVVSVFTRGSPPQVIWIAASQIPAPAIVSGLVRRARRWAISMFAGNPVNALVLIVKKKLPIPIAVSRVWPNETFIAAKIQNAIIQKFEGFALLGFRRWVPASWGTMNKPAAIMEVAPPPSLGGLVTTINGAYRPISHSAVPLRSGQGRGLFAQPFRPAFYVRFSRISQGLPA